MSAVWLLLLAVICCLESLNAWNRFQIPSTSVTRSSSAPKDCRSKCHSCPKFNLHYRKDDIDESEYEDVSDDEFNTRKSSSSRGKAKKSTTPKSDRPVVLNVQGKWKVLNRALLAGIFVAGIGLGVTIDSAINTNPKDLASRDAIDRNAPNPKVCAKFGSSAMVLDQRVFITFNPFNVYVTQADTKPGCVLRAANIVPLLQQDRKLLTDDEINACKNSFNTWAFVGDINNRPQLNCVFQSDDAQNEFLSNPKIGLGEDIYDRSNDNSNGITNGGVSNANGKLPGPKTGIQSSATPPTP